MTIFFCLTCLFSNAQTEVDERAVISFDKGLGFFSPDSAFGLNIRFRMQNRIGMTTFSGTDLTPASFEANVRRLRLRFDGFIGKTKLTYYLQLSFSRGDQDWDASGFPGIVRDAMVFYTFSENFYIGAGQGKLPGNRQRVVSSGQQQFADRSMVNATFNIDRDFGLMAYYSNRLGGVHYNLKSAITTGEGRNIQQTDNGLAYTARIEILPFGLFKNDGDFSEGDIERQQTPKLSVGAAYSLNKKAVKTSGQRGKALTHPTDIENIFVDMIAKYQGWALQFEFANRYSELAVGPVLCLPLTDPPADEYIFNGHGINTQLSYVFPGLFEIAGRHTLVIPDPAIRNLEPKSRMLTLGLTRYLPTHRNKIQLNLSHLFKDFPDQPSSGNWNVMVQVELGI